MGQRDQLSRRYLALWFPFLPAQAMRLEWRRQPPSAAPDRRPLLLIEKRRGALVLAAVDGRALKLGLSVGMTLADARSRVPECLVAAYDPDTDARVLTALSAYCERFTPLAALDEPHGACARYNRLPAFVRGDEAGLMQQACASLHQAGFSIRAAIASTPDAARAFARFADDALTISNDDEKIARCLPLAALELSHDTALALKRAGLRTLADLADRPSTAFAAPALMKILPSGCTVFSAMRTDASRPCAHFPIAWQKNILPTP